MKRKNDCLNLILSKAKHFHSTDYGFMAIGDSRKLVKYLPDNLFDTVITSPPYFNLKNYEHKNQIGNGQLYDKFLMDLKNIFSKCYDACKKTGSLWLVVDDFTLRGKPIHFSFEIMNILESIGWQYQETVIWYKDRTIPWYSEGKFRKAFEFILFFTKTNNFKFYGKRIRDINDLSKWWITHPERYKPMGKMPTDVWEIPLQFQGAWGGKDFPRHLCPFPFELVQRILTLVTNQKKSCVFDPFAGTGSVLAQANAMERHFVGFEINNNFLKEFKNKTLPAAIKRHNRMINSNFRNNFTSIIILLRGLKYCSTLIKEYRKITMNENGEANLPLCAFTLIDKKDIENTSLPLSVKIILLWKKGSLTCQKKAKLLDLINNNPLTRFQISASIKNYFYINCLYKYLLKNDIQDLYYYTVGNTYKYIKILSFNQLMETIQKIRKKKMKSIPIISNVPLSIDSE